MENGNITGVQNKNLSATILMPLPDHDFDPTEASIPWKVLTSRGLKIAFSTENGVVAEADLTRLNGPLPGLISASARVRAAYKEMTADFGFTHPIPYNDIDTNLYRALFLTGGDGPRMRQYLENETLRRKVLEFWRQDKLTGAICHGILVLARTIDPSTGRSILYGHKLTALPRSVDKTAYQLDSWFTKHGYIMYPQCVEDEVRACLANLEDFSSGPGIFTPYVVTDGNLVTSRWYIEAQVFAERFAETLENQVRNESHPI